MALPLCLSAPNVAAGVSEQKKAATPVRGETGAISNKENVFGKPFHTIAVVSLNQGE
jgi:hypothetical protein